MDMADNLQTEEELCEVFNESSELLKLKYLAATGDAVEDKIIEEDSKENNYSSMLYKPLDSFETPDLPDELEYQFNGVTVLDKFINEKPIGVYHDKPIIQEQKIGISHLDSSPSPLGNHRMS